MTMQPSTTDVLTTRFEDQRTVKNLMGKYVVSCLLKQELDAFESFWSHRPDICLSFNNGSYNGFEAVAGYYRALREITQDKAALLQRLFPDQLAGKSPGELYGIGPFEIKPLVNAIVEVATDGQSAKGAWCCQGASTDLYTVGPLAHWTWGYFCGDFLREESGWKIWHLLYVEDIHHPCGEDWTQPPRDRSPRTGFEAAAGFTPPPPNVPGPWRQLYSPERPFTPAPRFPEPYDTFSETFTYGLTQKGEIQWYPF